ncbi:12474_t:CDS:2 [Rhizophagus irregularis]|nr:12474_t:CDS:2 [Rhizophagus irregularis]
MNSNNLNEDFYQTAINYYGIKEILENFGNEKERIGQGSCIVYKTKCESLGGILIAIKEVNITSDDYVKERLYYLVLEYANQGNLREYINVKNCNENEELIKGTPIDYMKIYTNCWQSEPDFRPLISQILLQLQSMSLEPIFEGDDDKNSIYLLPPSDTSKNFISGYSPSLSSLAISENLASSFLSTNTICKKCEIQFKNYHWCHIKNTIRCYGFTQDLETKSYHMVLKYADGGNLRQYIRKKFPCRGWFKKLSILKKIIEGLHNIHKANYIHRDLYPGNILILKEHNNLEVYISELDSCANLNSEPVQQLYGNLSYIAPEVIVENGNLTSIKSDIYSIAPFKKHQFEAADRRVRGQPLGTRPSQLTKDNVKIVVESINVAEAYAGTTSFRFTNRSLQFDFSLPKPKNAIEKSLYFNGEGLLDE